MKITKGKFKIEIRDTCKVCGGPITGKRCRSYCSKKCREQWFRIKYKDKNSARQTARYDRIASESSPHKVKCLICGRYYVQVGSHIRQRHGMTAREYREQHELPIKRGILPLWYREKKATQALECGGAENLEKGKKYRYKKGDKRAIKNTGYKGRSVEMKRLPQEIYPHL